MTRSVYVTGIGRGDGRQVVELGVMELLTRQVDRVGVFRPLAHDDSPSGDRLYDLLRSRYRLTQPLDTVFGMGYEEAAALQADQGADELVSRLVERFHTVADDYDAVLVLGTDYADTQLPAELTLNARLANEFGAAVLPVVAGNDQSAESVASEVRNAHDAFTSLGCHVVATVANRVRESEAQSAAALLADQLPEPVYVLPEEPALSAPTVAQVRDKLGAEMLLGDPAGLARDVRDFVFGGAHLPVFLPALTEGCMVITPGDRADLVVGALAAHTAGSPAIAGVVLTLGARPGEETMALAARLAPGTPVLGVSGGSFPTAAELLSLEGRLTAATPRKAEMALGLFERHVDTRQLTEQLAVVRGERVTPMMFEHELVERSRIGPAAHRAARGRRGAGAARGGGAAAPQHLRSDAAGRSGDRTQAGRRPGHRSHPSRRGRTAHGGAGVGAHRGSADLSTAGPLRGAVRETARPQGRHRRTRP